MNFIKLLLVTFLASIVSCSIGNEYLNNNPNVSSKVRKAILNKEIFTSMTKEQVMASWGKEYRHDWMPRTGKDAKYERWHYFEMIASNERGWKRTRSQGQISLSYGQKDSNEAYRYQLIFLGDELINIIKEKGVYNESLGIFWPDSIR